ncbi:alpha/beta hydrolase [Paraflavitalea soli]|uniref:Alpha/beta hydrolase n=1 Tax=Paraflavitalea soli TaxID=2315862 RepID=A0A3B7MXU2_9BACT|nr:alpha/beta hydrolase [Paraflavitalea soli]AXY76525.1 alpha/beta hydrolase [Paraflavitalea soli]
MRKKKWWLITLLVIVIVYLMGPKPSDPAYLTQMPVVPTGADSLQQFIRTQESQHRLKPDNEARIVWANDSSKAKTDYSLVYLHGFSASQAEGDPVHRDIARKYGCNLYLSRLAEHGIDTSDALAHLTADKYWESAKEALAIGQQIGNKVILVGTSTGGTLALQLAAQYPEVYALVLLSPNIAINDPNAWLLNNPWGLQIARLVKGSKYNESDDKRDVYRQYWNSPYRLEAAVNLEELLETSMNKGTFEKVKQPTLLLYYFKDKVHQDSVVKVSAALKMFDELGTPAAEKRAVAMPNTGNHVMGSWIKSKDVPGVEREIGRFMEEILHVKPI